MKKKKKENGQKNQSQKNNFEIIKTHYCNIVITRLPYWSYCNGPSLMTNAKVSEEKIIKK